MIKAVLLDKKPLLKFKSKQKKSSKLDIKSVIVAIEALNLKYKRVDELDIYNILNYLESSTKEHK